MIPRRQPDADQKSMFGVRYVSHYRENAKNARLEAKNKPDSGISTHSNPFFEFANSEREGRAPSLLNTLFRRYYQNYTYYKKIKVSFLLLTLRASIWH